MADTEAETEAEIEAGAETAELSRIAELLLVRLLPAGKRVPGPKKLRDELGKLGGAPLTSEDAWAALLSGLQSAGLLAGGRGLRLSDAGRARALRVLGLATLPPGMTWPQLRDCHLLGVAAGVPGGGEGLRTKGKLSAFMLKRQFGLRIPDGATVNTAAVAVVCKELGFAELSDFKALQAAVLGRLLGSPQPLPPDGAVEQFVRVQLGAARGKVDELRQALIAKWVCGDGPTGAAPPPARTDRGSPVPPTPGPNDAGVDEDAAASGLAAFAAAARKAAAASPTGWFGDIKVFIAHAWRQFRAGDGQGSDLDLAAFKMRLLEAHRAGLLTLSRADLVAAMDPADVRESETRYLNAEFHFIRIEGGAR